MSEDKSREEELRKLGIKNLRRGTKKTAPASAYPCLPIAKPSPGKGGNS